MERERERGTCIGRRAREVHCIKKVEEAEPQVERSIQKIQFICTDLCEFQFICFCFLPLGYHSEASLSLNGTEGLRED